MGILIGFGVMALIIILLLVGRGAMLRESEKRVREWARSRDFVLDRCEMRLNVGGSPRPVWRIRVTMPSGERREGLARGGWSIYEPIEVEWAQPGQSVFK
jgi:hypothetical protein